MSSPPTLDALRRYAVARTLTAPRDLRDAIERLGFVQADPIRAPARAQDLTLRHRVTGYRAGDLEARYPALDIEEDTFINYGFLPRAHHALMHPRTPRTRWSAACMKRAQEVLEFVRERGEVHPRDVDAHFAHGRVVNYWGGSSNATTHMLDGMHYRGLLRVTRRDAGIRVYGVREPTAAPAGVHARRAQLDALVDVVVAKYAPLTASGLHVVVRRLRIAAPQLYGGIESALARVKKRLAHARIDGVDWYWPPAEDPVVIGDAVDDRVRLLAPFDPIAWDRGRFERLFGWAYRFEAYTPPARRTLGYYALPLLWVDRVVGWANATIESGRLRIDPGYAAGRAPRSRAFRRELDAEADRMRVFLRR
jgi:uncharacterized protein YcaQ